MPKNEMLALSYEIKACFFFLSINGRQQWTIVKGFRIVYVNLHMSFTNSLAGLFNF